MKLLFIDAPSFGINDIREAFEKLGFELVSYYDEGIYDLYSEKIENEISDILQDKDIVVAFSFNWYPLLSNIFEKHNIKYIAHVYDSPQKALFSTAILNECNYVFLFDSAMYNELHAGGINTVYYLPLMANVERLDKIVVPQNSLSKVSSEVSFVGSLYDEDIKHNYFDRMEPRLDEFTRGYLRGLIEAQLNVSGYSFVEDCLTETIIENMYKAMPYKNRVDGVETLQYIYAQYFIDYKITAIERKRLLTAVSDRFNFKLYTHNQPVDMPNAIYMGPIDWEESMPAVFKNSKINLNITLRAIRKGMSLRVFDILGAGGFLLSNYQEDFLEFFVPDEDVVFFDGKDDLLSKIEYYLSHDNERREIARNAYEKVKSAHTYLNRAKQMLMVAGININGNR